MQNQALQSYLVLLITKTCQYNFDPIKPHFSIEKMGFIHYFYLFLFKNIDCGYSLEPPRRGGSNEYHNLCFEQKYKKKISEFLSENYHLFFCVWLMRFPCRVEHHFSTDHCHAALASNVFRAFIPSRKHAYIILKYGKTGLWRGIHYVSYFCSKT